MRSLLFQNLKLTIPTALLFTVLGYILSLFLSFLTNPQAARWQFHLEFGPEPRNLDQLAIFQAQAAFSGTALGILIAQTTFFVYVSKFGLSNRSTKQ